MGFIWERSKNEVTQACMMGKDKAKEKWNKWSNLNTQFNYDVETHGWYREVKQGMIIQYFL